MRITRDPLTGTGRRIHLEEWADVVREDGEMVFDLASQVTPERILVTSILWIGHPEAGSADATQTLHYGAGEIFVAYPDTHLMKKMVLLARRLGAVVQGDNGEIYDLDVDGELAVDDAGPASRPQPRLYGPGARPCADLTSVMERGGTQAAALHYCWYLGFLTSFNQARFGKGETSVNYELTPDRTLEDQAFLRAYCAQNADKPFVMAALALIQMRDARPDAR